MATLHQIDVHGIRIYTNHGCMEEEAVIGSNYEVNISVWADLSASVASDDLNDTVDYMALNAIAKEEMSVRAKLLEVVSTTPSKISAALNSIRRLKNDFPSRDL